MSGWWATWLALGALMCSGCLAELGVEQAAPDSTATPTVPATPDESATPDSDRTPAPTPTPQDGGPDLDSCSADDIAQMDAAVAGQLDAFAAGDFEQALEFSSDGFRSQFPPADFEELIIEGFPLVTQGGGHSTGLCLTDGRNATLEVTVIGEGGETAQLLYLMELQADSWRIGGAVPAEDDAPQSA